MLTLAIIFAFLTIVLLVIGWYRSSSRFVVGKRIEQMMQSESSTAEETLEKPFAQRVLLPLGDMVAKLFRGYTPAEVAERTEKKLVMAGMFPRVTAMQLQGLCWICAALGFVFMFMLLVALGVVESGGERLKDPFNVLYMLIAVAAGFMFPHFVLSKRIQARQEKIQLVLPSAIDLLSISVEAGMGFDAAVGYTMRKIKGPLAEEFSKTLNEIRLGKPRLEALEALGKRTGVEDLSTFITAVVHASRLGGSITNTLRIQADSMRVRRRQRAQELAMKAPVKMVFPLVLFIFPALFVVILGPALMSVWKQMFAQ
jgi:tight adherence protein C